MDKINALVLYLVKNGIRRIIRQNRNCTAVQLTQIFNQGSSQQISARNMRRELQRTGMHSRVPVRTPLMYAHHAKIRLQWCRERRHWTSEDWKRVMWSDESRYATPIFPLMVDV